MSTRQQGRQVIVVGAGMGGLAAAIDLARRGVAVTLLERATAPGGKMRRVVVGDVGVDGGPTVFTMRWVFDGLLRDAGLRLEDLLQLAPAGILARHAWRDGSRLDLHADIDRSAEAIAAFAGAAEADGYRRFCAQSRAIYQTLQAPFIDAQKPTPAGLAWRMGIGNLGALWATRPWQTLWSALGRCFEDPRLRQLFGRYATYCGSSPLAAPATLMLVAYVEQDGVWQVRGGMHEVAQALAGVAGGLGARLHYGAQVQEILVAGGRCRGVVLDGGERLEADAVIFNGDCGAVAAGLLGAAAQRAVAMVPRAARSLSAVTWCVQATPRGFPLAHHNVFFAEDYPQEFRSVFADRIVATAPTVYVCAQDRGIEDRIDSSPERMLVLVNAPPDGDLPPPPPGAVAEVEQRSFGLLRACGLELEHAAPAVVTGPTEFERLFPATGGALYGRATHGPFATFVRPGARSRVPGLYFAGGSVHPGPGVPMATLSGRRAAECVAQDLGF